MVDLPFADGLHPDRQRIVADGRPRAPDHGLLAQVGLALRRVIHEQQHPFVPRAHADVRAAAHPVVVAGLGHPVQHARAVLAVLGQVYLEPAVDRAAQAHLPFHLEAALRHHGAAAAIGAHRVARLYLRGFAGDAVLHHGSDRIRGLRDLRQLGIEQQLRTALARAIQQHGLQQVLRRVAHRRGAGQRIVRLALLGTAPGLQPRDLGAGEAGGPHIVAHQRVGRGQRQHAVLDAEIAEHLHGALVGDVGTR
ncbi:hypothetical protein D3C81_1322070 [compost metagenome]